MLQCSAAVFLRSAVLLLLILSDAWCACCLCKCVQEAISKAVASAGRATDVATKKAMNYAQMAPRGGVQPYMFDDTGAKRHLLQNTAAYQRSDKMQMAGMAAQVGCECKFLPEAAGAIAWLARTLLRSYSV
jgi:hypothetical protein